MEVKKQQRTVEETNGLLVLCSERPAFTSEKKNSEFLNYKNKISSVSLI